MSDAQSEAAELSAVVNKFIDCEAKCLSEGLASGSSKLNVLAKAHAARFIDLVAMSFAHTDKTGEMTQTFILSVVEKLMPRLSQAREHFIKNLVMGESK